MQHTSVKKQLVSDNGLLQPSKKAGHNVISFMLSVIGIMVMLYIGIKYSTLGLTDYERRYGNYGLLLSVLGLIGFIFIDYIDDRKFTLIPKKFNKLDMIQTLIIAFAMFIIIIIVQFLTQITIRVSIALIDQILYFLFAGICEELFFRAFIINLMLEGLKRIKKERKTSRIFDISYKIITVLVSSIIFMIAHMEVYGSSLALLLATLFSGIVFGTFYIIFKDLGANQLSHVFVNLRAVGNVLVSF